jgi:hypothetical protein
MNREWRRLHNDAGYNLCSSSDVIYFFPSALQLRVSFGVLNNLPAFFDAMVDGCLGKRHIRYK